MHQRPAAKKGEKESNFRTKNFFLQPMNFFFFVFSWFLANNWKETRRASPSFVTITIHSLVRHHFLPTHVSLTHTHTHTRTWAIPGMHTHTHMRYLTHTHTHTQRHLLRLPLSFQNLTSLPNSYIYWLSLTISRLFNPLSLAHPLYTLSLSPTLTLSHTLTYTHSPPSLASLSIPFIAFYLTLSEKNFFLSTFYLLTR